MNARSLHQLTQKELSLIPPELNELKKCYYCARGYREISNFGRLACLIHPGIFQSETNHYSCCKRGIYARGCLRVDHIPEPITTESEKERHEALLEYAVMTIPKDYFYYGITQPLMESVLFRSFSSVDKKKTEVKYVMPFQSELVAEFDPKEELRGLQKRYKKMPLLAHHYKQLGSDEKQKKRMANHGWRNDISPTGIGEDDSDSYSDEILGEKDLEKLAKIDIPFVIIKRLA